MTSDQEPLEVRLQKATELVPLGSVYVHYKHPERTYRVIAISLVEETLLPAVVYEAHYGEKLSFIRPLHDFLETVEVDGVPVPRFTRLADSS